MKAISCFVLGCFLFCHIKRKALFALFFFSNAGISYAYVLFLIHWLVWCVKGTFFFNHTYPCINSACITDTMFCYVLVIHKLKILRFLPHKGSNITMSKTYIRFSNTSYQMTPECFGFVLNSPLPNRSTFLFMDTSFIMVFSVSP